MRLVSTLYFYVLAKKTFIKGLKFDGFNNNLTNDIILIFSPEEQQLTIDNLIQFKMAF